MTAGLPEADARAALEACHGDVDAALIHAVSCLPVGGAATSVAAAANRRAVAYQSTYAMK